LPLFEEKEGEVMEDFITPEHVKAIKHWLELDNWDKQTTCPFRSLSYPGCAVCKALFPLVAEEELKYCPCSLYPFDHVVKIFKQIVGGQARQGKIILKSGGEGMKITHMVTGKMAEMARALLVDYTAQLDEAWLEAGEDPLNVAMNFKLREDAGKLICTATISFTAKKVKDKYDAVVDDARAKLFGENQKEAV